MLPSKGETQMKALLKMVLVLVCCGSLQPVLAEPPKAPAQTSSVYDAIMQRTHEWGDAELAGDADTLNQIVADDWTAGHPDRLVTKATFLSNVRSGKSKLLSYELG